MYPTSKSSTLNTEASPLFEASYLAIYAIHESRFQRLAPIGQIEEINLTVPR